jgi:uncharacterized protein YqeY
LSSIKAKLADDIKSAMRAKDTQQLTTLRLVSAAIKQKEVDDRVELDDPAVLAVIEKMVKQRKDAIEQFAAGGRQDLVDKESAELQLLNGYLPAQLSADEVAQVIDAAVAQVAADGASGPAAMGKVMAIIKPQLAGRADMGLASRLLKDKLAQS